VALAQTDLPELIRRVSPAVVTVKTVGSLGQDLGQGSGFFISDTMVVTNHHVVEGASDAIVRLKSGQELDVLGILADDPIHDVTLLSIQTNGTHSTILRLATDLPEVGVRVVVLGTPEGFEQTASPGIVSAINEVPGRLQMGRLVQTTAPINHGNSGGPMLDMHGDVVAVATLTGQNFAENLNFAVPSRWVAALTPGALRPLRLVLPELTSSPADVPDGILDQLSSTQRKLLYKEAPWYVRLPDGRCVNMYRALRVAALVAGRGGEQADQDLEAFGYPRGGGGRVVLKGLPPWYEPAGDWVLCLGVAPHPFIDVVERVRAGLIIGKLGSQIFAAYVPDDPEIVTGSVLRISGILYPVGSADVGGQKIPVLKYILLRNATPTPAQLAFAVMQRKASIVLHSYSRSVRQPTKTIYYNMGMGMRGRRTVKKGPPIVTYRWKSTPVDLRFRPAQGTLSGSRKIDGRISEESADGTTGGTPVVSHRMYMQDGRILSGRLIRRDNQEVVFAIVAGRMVKVMTFHAYEVQKIENAKGEGG